MPPVQQDQLTPFNTSLTFEDLNTTPARRILHNGTDILKLNHNVNTATFFGTDGSRKTSIAFEKPNILDITFDHVNKYYYTVRYDDEEVIVPPSDPYPVLAIERVDSNGFVTHLVADTFILDPELPEDFEELKKWKIGLAIDDEGDLYLTQNGDVYKFPSDETLSGVTPIPGTSRYLIDESASGVSRAEDVILEEASTYSFSFNDTHGGFLSYVDYEPLVEEVRIHTLTTDTPPEADDRILYLDIRDWIEHEDVESPYQLFWHGLDNNTLLYARKHGTQLLNATKVSSSAGVVSVAGSVLTDSTKNFLTAGVKPGDLIIINKASYASNGTYTIVNIPTNTSIVVDDTLEPTTAIPYTIHSNAELLQFNADVNISAFTAVNVDDFNLRAGTSDNANITVKVINAWGDPLNGKLVNFQIITGDGVVNPPSATTNPQGQAQTQYSAGSIAGPVQVQVTVAD